MSLDKTRELRHHAFAIEASEEEGTGVALAWLERELGMREATHPDIVVLKYGLFTVEDARRVSEIAVLGPVAGEAKAIIIAASRAYREAQNALLKLFEEPPAGTYLFLILPSLGGLLPTLRSRVQILPSEKVRTIVYTTVHTIPPRQGAGPKIAGEAMQFLTATREKRSAIVKKLASGKDEEERREHRDEALAIVNGIEVALLRQGLEGHAAALREISIFRGYLHDRSAPVRMILEHLAIVTPKNLI